MPRILIDGIQLEFHRFGTPSDGKPTLIFLHHGLGSAGLWRDFPQSLGAATGLPGMAYSRHGYGKSDTAQWPKRPDFLQHEALVVLPKVLDALAIGDVICIGHSEGGSIALVFAATQPDRVRGVAIFSAHVHVEEKNLQAIQAIRGRYRASDDLRQALARHHEDVDQTFNGFTETWLNPDFATWSIESYLPQVTCPVLAVRGSADEYISDAHHNRLVGLFGHPIDSLVLDVGHAPHEESEAVVLERLTGFIDGLR